MNKLEDKLKNIKLRELSNEDKNSIWNSVLFRHLNLGAPNAESFSYISIFSFHIRKFAFATMALFLIVFAGGAGMIRASDNAVPGSRLFSLDLAVENFQIKVAAPEEKDKLRLKFAEERVVEVKTLSALKTTTVLVKAPEDGAESEVNTIQFSKEENAGVEVALNNLTKLVTDSSDKENADKIEKAQEELLVILGDDANLVVKRVDGVITVDGKDESVREEVDEADETESTPIEEVEEVITPTMQEVIPAPEVEVSEEVDATIVPPTATLLSLPSVTVGEEIFCQGEWRPSLDCDTKTEVKTGEGEVKGAVDEMGPETTLSAEMEIRVKAERARNCTEALGIYDLSYDECLGVDGAMCSSIGGAFNECASACRNQPGATICTMQCVQVCEFKSEF